MPVVAKLGKRTASDAGYWACALEGRRNRLYAAATDSTLHVFDAARPGEPLIGRWEGHGSYVTAAAWSNPAGRLISGSFDRSLIGWTPDGKPAWRTACSAPVKQIAVSPDGSTAAAVLDELKVLLVDVETGKTLRILQGGHAPRTEIGRPSTLYCAAWSPDGRRIATGDRAGDIGLWDAATGKFERRVDGRSLYSQSLLRNPRPDASEYEWGGVRSLCYSPDGRRLFAGGMGPADQNSAGLDGLMQVLEFDAATGKALHQFSLEKSKGVLCGLTPLPDGRWLAGCGGGGGGGAGGSGTLFLWDSVGRDDAAKPLAPLIYPTAMVARDLTATAGGKTLILVGMEKSITAGRVEWWDLA